MKGKIKTNPMGVSDWNKITKEELLESDGNHSFLHYVILHDHWEKLPEDLKEFSLYQNNDGNNEKIIHLMARLGKVETISKNLLTHDLLSLKNKEGETVYHILANTNYVNHIPKEMWTKKTLTIPNNFGITPLHAFARFNCTLIPKDITLEDLLLKDHNGDSPLCLWIHVSRWEKIPDKFFTKKTLELKVGQGKFETIMHHIAERFKEDQVRKSTEDLASLDIRIKKMLSKVSGKLLTSLFRKDSPELSKHIKKEMTRRIVKGLSSKEQSIEI